MTVRLFGVIGAAATLAALAVAGAAFADHPGEGGTPFTATLLGANECNSAGVCNQGDPDGSGTATLRLNQGLGEVCYDVSVAGVQTITAAHIHVGAAGLPGPVVIPTPPAPGDAADGEFSGCTTGVSPDLIKAIRQSPGDYYFNVHNPTYPAGALRGQLEGPGDS